MGLADNIRTVTALLTITAFILYIKLKNLLFSFFLVTFYSFQLFLPNKYYIVEVLKSYQLPYLPNFEGLNLGYGVNIPNIFVVLTSVLIIRNIIIKKKFIAYEYLKILLPVFIAAILFFSFALTISLNLSPYKELSFVWLLQYMQVSIVGFIFVYIYYFYPKKFPLVFPTLLTEIFFQFFLSLRQFGRQSMLGLAIEKTLTNSLYDTPPDENNAISRVSGTFFWPNQLALIMLLLTLIILPICLRKLKKIYLLGIFASLITILLTQSRSAWLACFSVALIIFKYFNNEISNLFRSIGLQRMIIYTLLIIIFLSYVILPRIFLTLNTFDEGAGMSFRIKIINEGLEALSLNPWMGYGIGTNEYTLYKLFPTGTMSEYPITVHLAFLQFALETGIVGLLLFLFPFFYIIRSLINNSSKQSTKEGENYKFIFISGSLVFFIDYLFLAHTGIIEFAYLGIILGFGLISLMENKHQLHETYQ